MCVRGGDGCVYDFYCCVLACSARSHRPIVRAVFKLTELPYCTSDCRFVPRAGVSQSSLLRSQFSIVGLGME